MENMKQKILELVGKEKKNTLNRSAIASRLGVTKSADFIVFDSFGGKSMRNKTYPRIKIINF